MTHFFPNISTDWQEKWSHFNNKYHVLFMTMIPTTFPLCCLRRGPRPPPPPASSTHRLCPEPRLPRRVETGPLSCSAHLPGWGGPQAGQTRTRSQRELRVSQFSFLSLKTAMHFPVAAVTAATQLPLSGRVSEVSAGRAGGSSGAGRPETVLEAAAFLGSRPLPPPSKPEALGGRVSVTSAVTSIRPSDSTPPGLGPGLSCDLDPHDLACTCPFPGRATCSLALGALGTRRALLGRDPAQRPRRACVLFLPAPPKGSLRFSA